MPGLDEALRHLSIPVVPLVTALAEGLRAAGAIAAYLVEQWMADRAGDVLLVGAAGGDERVAAFRASISPTRRLVEVPDAEGAREILAHSPAMRAVYGLGGGNAAVVAAFAAERRNYDVFVAHGLDGGNEELLRDGRISAVLRHDVRADLRQAYAALFGTAVAAPRAAIAVLTPFQVERADGVPNNRSWLSGSVVVVRQSG